LVYTFVDGWVMGLERLKVLKMFQHLDTHTVGYLIIALVYVIMAFK